VQNSDQGSNRGGWIQLNAPTNSPAKKKYTHGPHLLSLSAHDVIHDVIEQLDLAFFHQILNLSPQLSQFRCDGLLVFCFSLVFIRCFLVL